MRPPELHILRIVLRREVFAILEVDDTAILLIPTPLPRPVENAECHLIEVITVGTSLGTLHDEPSRLNAMSRIDHTSGNRINQATIRSHTLQQCLKLRVHKVMFDVVERALHLRIEVGMRDDLLHDDRHVDQHHRDAVAPSRHCRLRWQETRCSHHATNVLKLLQRLLGILPAACSFSIFSHGHGTEALAEDVTTFLNTLTLGRNRKELMPIRIDTMVFEELDAAERSLQPLWALLYMVVGVGTDKAKASLEPDRLGAVHQTAVAVQAGINSPVDAVQSMLHPEGHDIIQQVAAVGIAALLEVYFL